MSSAPDAFGNVATRYDADSTYLELSLWFRALVQERMARIYAPGMHLLELGCGTGEDAIWHARRGLTVTATDGSAAMLAVAREKAQAAGIADRITFKHLDFADTATWTARGPFDGVYSNYGALNCMDPRGFSALGEYLANAVRPGGVAGFCVIGRVCPWEMAWHGAHLHFRTALRRLPGHATAHLDGRYFPVYYPTPGSLARRIGAGWKWRGYRAVGVWLPPSDLYRAVGRRGRFARALLALEKRTAAGWPFRALGDHYWLELERAADGQ